MNTRKSAMLAIALLLLATMLTAAPMGTAFTYQGSLADGTNAANGSYDLRFTLYDAATNGSVVAGPLTLTAVAVTNGQFTAALDFGAAAFNGDARWLSLEVRTNSGGAYTPLSPRQQVRPTPYALLASQYMGAVSQEQLPANVALLDASQTFTGDNSFSSAGNSFSGSGSELTSLNASQLASGTVADARLSGNVALENVANAFTADQTFYDSARLWNTDLYFRQGSSDTNHGIGYYTGTSGFKPFGSAYAIDGPVLYGYYAGVLGTKYGGAQEVLYWRSDGRVGIGTSDPQETLHVEGTARVDSLVGNGGLMTVGTEDQSALELQVWGVPALQIEPPPTAGSAPSFVGGWVSNSITAGVVGGVVAGGGTPLYGGNPRPNKVTDHYGVVSGGMGNQSGNGGTTLDDAQGATIGGGYANSASASWATVGGGWYNRVTYERGTVGGGWNNLSSSHASTVSGGRDNIASGSNATVPGGQGNVAQGDFSFAAGHRAKANHSGTFVWGDSTDADFSSTANNQFLVRAAGGVGIGTDSPAEMLDVDGNVKIQGTGNGLLFPDGSKQTTAASSGSGLTLPYSGTLSSSSAAFKVTNTGSSGEAIEGLNSVSGNYGRLGTGGYGVYGRAVAAGDIGVYGWAPSSGGGTGVEGVSWYGTGVSGETGDGIGVYAVASGDAGTGLYAKGTEYGFAAYFDGWIQGPVKIWGELEIHGGADLSEAFDVRTASPQIEPEAGMLVSIDREHPGGLLVSSEAYDRCVAGIISGAGGIVPAMVMGQEQVRERSGLPIALSGRVYCLADTSNGSIEPGDLLTSSVVPGHAMKVTDHARAQGAVIGKAMSSLEQGRGMVLVLVNLQ